MHHKQRSILQLVKTKRKVQADDKDSVWSHQINWVADIQAKMRINTATNISSMDITRLEGGGIQAEVLQWNKNLYNL